MHGRLANAKSPEHAWTTNIHLEIMPHVYFAPEATVFQEIQECLTNSQKYLSTFQLFIHATNFGHNNIISEIVLNF